MKRLYSDFGSKLLIKQLIKLLRSRTILDAKLLWSIFDKFQTSILSECSIASDLRQACDAPDAQNK